MRRFLLAPDLERAGIHNGSLVLEIERVEDERFSLRVKDPAEGFLGAAAAINVENIRNMKLSRTHEFANVPLRSEILFRVFEPAFLISVDGREFFNSRFERGGPYQYSFAFGPQACELGSNILISLIRVLRLSILSVAL